MTRIPTVSNAVAPEALDQEGALHQSPRLFGVRGQGAGDPAGSVGAADRAGEQVQGSPVARGHPPVVVPVAIQSVERDPAEDERGVLSRSARVGLHALCLSQGRAGTMDPDPELLFPVLADESVPRGLPEGVELVGGERGVEGQGGHRWQGGPGEQGGRGGRAMAAPPRLRPCCPVGRPDPRENCLGLGRGSGPAVMSVLRGGNAGIGPLQIGRLGT